MDIQTFIVLTSVAVVLIVMAIDIPTSKWMFKYRIRRRKPLWRILHDSVTQETRGIDETKAPATTYTEAVKRMQEREKTHTHRRTSRQDSS
jgi:hypothetical protein